MLIESFILGDLGTNTYLISNEKEECLLVDPADSADFLLELLVRRKLKLKGLIATHGHYDHILAVGELQVSYDIPLYINPKDTFLLERMGETAERFSSYKPVVLPIKNCARLKEGKMSLGSFDFEAIFTPGHTPGSVCLYFKEKGWLISGDTLFKNGIGSYDHQYSSKGDLLESIHKKLFILPEETIVYSGHGDETTIGEEMSDRTINF
ncbi:MAG: MBL fold metallo-hydrolase [Candidatus Roizmanbacteria bacterium]